MIIKQIVCGLAIAFVVSIPATAWAHGDAITTDPASGDRVGKAPEVVSIEFSEPPTKDSKFTVRDGCGDDVLVGVVADGNKRLLRVGDPHPGKWTVSYNVVSATDGHHTQDRFAFVVAGKKECNGSPAPEQTHGVPDESLPRDDGSSSFPLAPVVIGGVIIVGAVTLRLISAR
jgi:methionine-rich copper-binding protein CopC